MTTFTNRYLRPACLATFAIASIACGGGAASSTETTPGETIPGAPTTAGGESVSAEAQTRWQDAATLFNQYAADGLTQDECNQVISRFEQANNSQRGRFTEAIYMTALVHERCGNQARADELYRRALETNERFCGARVAVGIAKYRAGQIAEARAEFERSVRDDTRCAEGYTNLAIVQRRNQPEENEAIQNLRRALAIEAEYMPAFNQLALIYLSQAQRLIGAPAQVATGAASTSGAAASRTEDRGQRQLLDLAELVCSQGSRINANYAPLYNTWGLINVTQGNIVAALAKFDRASQLDPNLFESFMNFGEITLSFRGYEDAERAFRRATTLQANSYDAFLGLGAALRGLRRVDDAQAAYERAIQIDVNRSEAYYNLGLLWQDYRGGTDPELNRAKEYYQQFVQRAQGRGAALASTVEGVTRRCQPPQQGARRRRRRGPACEGAGRIQQIDDSIRLRQELEEMQRQMGAQNAAAPAAQ